MKRRCIWIALAVAIAAIDTASGMNLSARLEFLPGWRHVDETGEYHVAGIRMKLDDGWKTYWRVPGEGGISPQVEIESSENLSGVSLLFPSPKVFEQNGMLIFGYEREVLFPLIIYPEINDTPIFFEANFYGGICEEVCIPVSFPFSASLPPHEKADDEILNALDLVPKEWNASEGPAVECAFEFSDFGLFAKARLPIPNSLGPDYVVFEYADDWIRFGRSQVSRPKSSLLEASSAVYFGARKDLQLTTSKLRITVLSQSEVVDIKGCGSS
ncbi:MAG: protein-disulfide reductase DsbD family protein [Albidovulum sp.]|nr:protein-disulfide reductase DsbD family protein [Albidovulum sp.]MDE0531623.1 protein-disulfide reductase DsbD family protein [Albidovulum sp.]